MENDGVDVEKENEGIAVDIENDGVGVEMDNEEDDGIWGLRMQKERLWWLMSWTVVEILKK